MQLINKLLSVLFRLILCIATLPISGNAVAGAQIYTPLSASVRTVLQRSVSDQTPQKLAFADQYEADVWLAAMSPRLKKYIPDEDDRLDLLRTIHYEAVRAGLDPELVLGLIQVESGFKKYAISSAGARGYMQVMPFWTKEIGSSGHNLFHLRTNLRYGCTILRHYLDIEKGDLFRALGRYNGSLGRAQYPNLVRAAWNRYLTIKEAAANPSHPS
ncbi:MAG: lytic transglycosylase domain-containing protein [Pseudomonadota bacterium]